MLNKEEARRLFENGKKLDDVTHLIIANNHYDRLYVTRYVRGGASVKGEIDDIKSYCAQASILAVLNYDLPIEEQLREQHPMHTEPSLRYLPIYDRVLNYATEKHANKKRKGRIEKPYIEHPKEVSELVGKYMKKNPKVEIYKLVALLHDTLENTDATYPEISEKFGEEVASKVQALTSDKELQKKFGKSEYLTTKLLAMDDDTLTIKLCDRLSNVRDLSITDDIDFKKKYTQETTFILNNLVLHRKLTTTHLTLLNDIALELDKVAKEANVNVSVSKEPIIYKFAVEE